ncbi:MAG: selenium-binding protein [Verrucomicrobia bacterium]|nr:selenium-binding protein [Verrucomicrobiota bacterium]MBV9672591.1 selenium-binding protein [Verrucomicrobiota bacterium]
MPKQPNPPRSSRQGFRQPQFRWKGDPSFYPTARLAMTAPPERQAFVAALSPDPAIHGDAVLVVDVDSESASYGAIIGRLDLPNRDDEVHHFGWNACSTALCPYAPHPHLERRFLIVPGLRSSRIYIIDTKPDPRKLKIVKIIEPEEVFARTGYSRPHTIHCGPEGIYVSALGAPDGGGPGGIFLLDHFNFNVLGRWEVDRGPQQLAYDFWWHLGHDVMITSEWGTPNRIENGVIPEDLLASEYGHQLHVWNLRKRKHEQTIDFGKEQQMVLELRPSHDPTRTFGFAGVVISLKDLSSSVWLWKHSDGKWEAQKVIEIPAEPADPDQLPPLLKGFKAVPPLVTDINLSLDDKWLFVSCWATGELRRYDVSQPDNPKLSSVIQLGGIVRQATHPKQKGQLLGGGPQMIELSRDGKRVYFTNSLYRSWDDQFYPNGVGAWFARANANEDGTMELDPRFLVTSSEHRLHQVHLNGGDASSDSFCYPS